MFLRHKQQKSERYRLTKPSITLATVCLSKSLFNTKKQTLPYVTVKTPYLIATSTRKEVQIIDLQGLHAQGTLHLLLTTLIQHRHVFPNKFVTAVKLSLLTQKTKNHHPKINGRSNKS